MISSLAADLYIKKSSPWPVAERAGSSSSSGWEACSSHSVLNKQSCSVSTVQAAAGGGGGGLSIYGHSPAPITSAADSAAPGGLEFWLPGKVPVLGDRGLSFVRFHPSCKTLKAPHPALSCEQEPHVSVYLSFGAGDLCQKWSIQQCPEAFLMLFCCWRWWHHIEKLQPTSHKKIYLFFLSLSSLQAHSGTFIIIILYPSPAQLQQLQLLEGRSKCSANCLYCARLKEKQKARLQLGSTLLILGS